jgi:hypothetical protein
MKKARIITLMLVAMIPAVLVVSTAFGAVRNKQALVFHRVGIKSGYMIMRNIPSVKGTPAGVFYAGDDCIPALGERRIGARSWMKVFHPYLRSTGWVDSRFMVPTRSNCNFERFLYNTKGKTDWVFGHMTFPLVISSPNVEEKPSSYTKTEVLSSTDKLNDSPYYYLQLLDDRGMKKFWAERDGCAKYELIENRKYDINSYRLYTITKSNGVVSLAFSCVEIYPEFKFQKSKNGYTLTGIVDSGS